MSAMLKQKLIDIANGFTKYGLWKGGSSNLSELDDVTLTNLQKNDVLTYNGSEWVNDDNLQTQIDTLNSNLDKIKLSLSSSVWNGIFTYDKKNKEVEFTINIGNYVKNGSVLLQFRDIYSLFIPNAQKIFYGTTVGGSTSSTNRFMISFNTDGIVRLDCLDIDIPVAFYSISGKYFTE